MTRRLHALTILLGSFLLFQVHPLVSKWILPWFGGGPEVWTVRIDYQAAENEPGVSSSWVVCTASEALLREVGGGRRRHRGGRGRHGRTTRAICFRFSGCAEER